ncbi:hypothetical protein FHS55_002105 [Angulomicrobium tetraedrale]|uniref:Uncharacterized protein n=1 Tax=Ancylobacter tetraedralis TaxID=217068 RepID=A0A839Z9V0_9HYPH|nr:hypothetical protein [Ancylobacter tetraedralis]MBB3771506.1 hypothetical protein [Ancylobacter tetraedralis]
MSAIGIGAGPALTPAGGTLVWPPVGHLFLTALLADGRRVTPLGRVEPGPILRLNGKVS